jgi:hypothetical protein
MARWYTATCRHEQSLNVTPSFLLSADFDTNARPNVLGVNVLTGKRLAKIALTPRTSGSIKGQFMKILDSGQSFGCRPMTLSGSKYVNQQIRPPLAAPMMQ